MRERALGAFVVFLSFFLVLPVAFPESAVKLTDWRDLSDRRVSADGRAALQINRELWKHAETEHFIYHFRDEKEAETIYIHAEETHRWIQETFGTTAGAAPAKCHIYIFENETVWKEFNRQPGERLPGAEAYTNGSDLFIYREPFFLSPQKTLAHEITHIVVHEFLKGRPPLFLDEGFAEFMSYKAIARQAGGNEYDLRTIAMIPEKDFVALGDLAAMKNYPETPEAIKVFYEESELFTRYLILNHDRAKFISLLERTASGASVDEALQAIYGADLETMGPKFRTYAVVSSQK